MTVSEKYPWLEKYLLAKKGTEKDYKAEWNWTRFMVGGKTYAAFCGEGEENVLFTVKCDPELNIELRKNYPDIIPGYYCNKEHWNSVKIPGNVPDEVIKQMCDRGYYLVFKSLTKKAKEIINNK